MNRHTRSFLNSLSSRLSGLDHALQYQLAEPACASAPRPWLRRAARVFTSLFVAQTLLASMPAHAQITAAPGAPSGQKPLIDAAANGTPIVLIAPPSKAGVSRNQYEQLNVGPKGLILNNSTGNVQTQIGGWISGNLQLGLTPARIILNEVTGPHASQLRGTIEVGGQKADIVIANPNGISCDGCGFLNSDRATLTTGTPRIGADGAVSGFDVRQGVIQIGPDGLNATEQQQLELHARGLVIEGEVYSQNLQAVIGANQVVYGTLSALPQHTAQDGTGQAPRFAIDIKALGGMYAGQIYLIATDKGLGVNSTGRAATLAGNLVLSANGDLTLKDTYASGNAQLTSAGMTTLTGQTVAEGSVTIESAQALTNSGALQAPTLQLNAPALHNSGSIHQTAPGAHLTLTLPGGLHNSGDIYTPGNLTVQAPTVHATGGSLAAQGHVRLAGDDIALARTRIAAAGEVQIASTGAVAANAADIHSNAALSIQGARVDVSAGTMTAAITASIKADGEIRLDGSQLAAGQRVDLQGRGISTPGATVTADKISIDAGTGALTNPGGKILASAAEGDALTVNATGITNQGGELRANGGLVLDARGGVIDNTAGVIAGTTGTLTNLGGLTNKGGTLYTQSDLAIAGTALDNSQGTIVTAGSLSVTTPGQTINNTQGLMQAGGSVSLDSGSADLQNAGGTVVAGTQLTVNAGVVDTAAGTLAAGSGMTVKAGDLLAGSARLGSGGAMNITASGNANLGTAQVGAGGDLTIQAGTVQAAGANVASNANVQVTGGSITGGNWSAQGNLAATSAGVLNVTGGSLLAGGNLTAQGQGITTDNARVAGQEVTLDAGTGALSNLGGQIHARSNLHIQASQLANRGGTVATGGALTLQGAALDNHAGTLQATGHLTLHTAGQALDNTGGKLISGGNATVQAGALSNSGGTISAGGTAHVQAVALNTAQGQISGTRQLDILVTQRLTATGATLGTEGNFTASAGEIDARSATVTAGETLSMSATGATDVREGNFKSLGALHMQSGAALAADAATIRSGDTVQLSAQGISAAAGQIGAMNQITLDAGTGNFTAPAVLVQAENGGIRLSAANVNLAGSAAAGAAPSTGLLAGQAIAITATGAVDVSGAATNAGTDVTITAQGSLTNQGGRIIAGHQTSLSGASLNNQGGTVDAHGPVTVSVTTGEVNNDQGRISTRDVLTMGTPTGGAPGPLTSLTNAGGVIETTGALNAQLQSFNNEGGSVVALAGLAITGGPVNNTGGQLASQGNINVNTQGGAFSGDSGKVLSTQGTIALTTGAAALNNAQLLAGQNIALTAGATSLNAATVTSGGNTTFTTGDLQASQAQINAQGTFNATASGAVTADLAVIAAGGGAGMTATQGIAVNGGSVSAQTINLDAGSGALNNTSGNLTARATTGTVMTLQGQGLTNDGGTIASNADLSINAGAGSLGNAAGQILAVGAADIRATGLNNVGGTMASNGNLTINAAQAHANAATDSTGGTLQSGQNLTLTAGATALTNATVTSGDNTTLNTAALEANQARINAGGNFSATSSAAVAAQQLALAAGGSAAITAAQGIDLSQGSVSAQTINVNAGGVLNNTSGNLTASATTGTALTVQSQGLVNDQGTIASNAGLNLNSNTGSVSNAAGRVLALGAADVRSIGLANVGGTIASNGDLTINAAQAHANAATDSTGGTLQSGQNITLTAGATTLTNATVTSGGNTTLNTGALQANQARINALGNFSATSSAAVAALQLALAAGGSAAITAAQGIDLSQGSVSAQTIALTAGGALNNTGGNLHAGATTGTTLTLQSQGLVNDQGTIASNAGLSIQASAGSISNAAGRVLALGAADVRSTGLNNATGTIASNGDLTINTVQAHANAATDSTGGTLQSGHNIALTAGSTTLTNATVTSGGNTTLNTGALQASQARINALGNFTATSSGAVTADQMALAAGGGAAITATQGIDVNSGTISAQTINLNAGGGVLNNNAGSIQAVGALDIRSTGLNNRAGTIASNGDLTLNAALANAIATLDSTDGAIRSAQAITLTAGATTLTNATVTSGGNTTLNTGDLQASQARINVGGNLTATSSGTLNNNAGGIMVTGAADIRSTGLSNVDGTIAANGALTVNAAQANTATETNNTRGTIRSAQSSVTLTTGALINSQADISAAADVHITATGALANDHARIVAGRDAAVTASAIGNTSGLIAGNRDTSITAGAGGITNTSGAIQASHNLAVTSAGDVSNTSGKLLAGNQLSLSGGALTNSQGQIGAQTGSVTLTVTSYTNTGGSVVAGSALTLDTQGGALTANGATFASGADMTLRAGAAQLNDAAITSGGAINAQATSLEAARANVQAAGNLTANAGTGAFNAANSTWQAGQAIALTGGAVAVADATVSANTTVAVTGASVDATRASITSPGDVSVVATHGALNITNASLLAGRDLTATGTGAGTTTGAQALAGRDLTLGNGTAFDFAAAGLQYQFGRDLTVRAQGISTAGQQVSARNLTLDAGSGQLNNQGGNLQATGTLTASGTGLNNQSGVIAANGQVTASAGTGTLNNASGQIYSTQGATSVSGATIANATGTLSAATDVSITGGTLNNAGNTIAAGRNLSATLSGDLYNTGGALIANTGAASINAGDVHNQGGVISGNQSVTMITRAIHNDGGVIESGAGGISINTQGHALTNTHSGTTRGIVSQGNITIAAGDINNQLGYIGANGTLTITQSSTIHNQGGTLLGLGGVSVTTGTLNNQGSSVLSGGDATVNAGTVNNGSSGTIYAARDLTVNASTIDNSNTRNGGYTTGLLAGRNAAITAATLNNANGAIVALGDATVRATSSLNNTQGQISGHTVTIQTPSLTNTAGRADAQQRMTLQVPQFSADGVLASNGAMNLELQGNYVNSGTVSASGDLNISTTGSYTNLNRVSAQNALSLTAAGIDNAAGATIDSQRTTLNALGGTLNNAGLINSTAGQTTISAGTLNNTGRIYGDSIALNANVNNSAAAGNGAAIATRGGSVTINGALNNTDDALVLSLGNIQINGSARNDGSTINAMGNVTITGALTNTHVGMQTGSQTRTEPAHAVYITPSGSTTRYNVSDLAWTGHTGGHWVLPSTTYPLGSYGADPKPPAMQCGLDGIGGEGGSWVCNPGYSVHDPIWSLMRVASPGAGPGPIPMECMDFGGETGNAQRVTSGACGGYWASYDAYTVHSASSYASLDAAIAAFNNDLNHRTLIDWYETTITGTTITETTAVPGRAGKVLAGGNMSIGGGTNHDSIIVAGGSLNGGALNNVASQGTQQTSATGYYVFSHRTWSGGFSSSYGRETSAPQPIADAPVTQSIDLPILQYQSSGNPAAPGAGGSSSPVGGAAASVVGVGRTIGTERNANNAGTATGTVQTGTPSTGAGAAVQVQATTTTHPQNAPWVNGAQNTGGSTVTAGTGNSPSGNTTVTAGTGANPTGNTALNASTGNTPTAGTAVTAGNGNGSNAASTVQTASGTHPTGAGTSAITASLSAAPEAALPGSVIAAGVRAGQLAAITTSLTNFAANAAIQPPQAQAVDTSTRRSAPATVKADGYSTFRASGAVRAPANQLFRINRNPKGPLVETDPAFTGYRTWISSAYMLQQLALDPERNMKLYGDGFAEQRLIDDQILALTGRRFLSGYQSTEDQYHDLMDAGVMFAKAYQLTPGVALSAEQMALLTTDIVWLEAKAVTLPDGSTTIALVPTVYLRRPIAGDLTPTGALIAGSNVTLRSPGDLTNTGTIIANGDAANGDGKLSVTGSNVNNSGTLAGNQIAVTADNTINNTGGVVQGLGAGSTASLNARDIILRTTVQSSTASIEGPNGTSTGTRTNADRIATVSADSVKLAALNNINLVGASVNATGNLTMMAGGAITSEALQTGYTLNAPLGGSNSGRTGYISEAAVTQQLTNIAGNNVTITATGDAAFKGTNIKATNDLAITGKTVTIDAVKESISLDQQGIGKKGYERVASSDEMMAGANVTVGNNVTVRATGGDISATGATISAAKGAATLVAAGDVTLNAATTQHSALAESYNASKGLLSSKSTLRESDSQATLAEGSSVSGKTVAIAGGRDVNVQGSTVVSDLQTTISAARNVNITAATETLTSNSFAEEKKSGLFGSGGFGVTLGKREQSTDTDTTSTRSVASTVGSVAGNINIVAGAAYNQVGSNVVAPGGNVTIAAKTVAITEGRETSSTDTEQKFKQSGITLAINSPVLAAAQTIHDTAKAAAGADDPRIKALAAATAALAVKNAADAVANNPGEAGGASISLSIGTSKSQSEQHSTSNTAAGSTVLGGGNVAIIATGAGQDSNILIRGSDVQAATGQTILRADNQILLQAGQNTASQNSKSSSSSASIGGTLGAQGVGVTVSASTGRGSSDGQDLNWTNTYLGGGTGVRLQSGGDTELKGAVVSGPTVTANVGGNLRIESLQDTSIYKEDSKTIGGSVTIGPAPAGSFNFSKTKIDSNYQSVTEQSGIKAGDGGFNVTVAGTTDLKGGVIASTDKAVLDGKNTFTPGGAVTITDIHNTASYKGSSVGIGLGYSASGDGVGKDNQGNAATGAGQVPGSNLGSLGGFSATPPAGLSASGSASSTTAGGISGIAGNAGVRTGNGSGGIQPILNIDQIKAGFAVTSALVREVGTFLDNRAKEADAKKTARDEAVRTGDAEAARKLDAELKALEQWAPNGAYRQVTTAVVGALSGNVTGSAGQVVQGAVINYLQALGAQEVGRIADNLGNESARTALQGIVACAGAAAQGASCQAAALGASAGTVINALLGDSDSLSASERETRRNLVTNLVAALVSGSSSVAVAITAAAIETENNALSLRGSARLNDTLRGCMGKTCNVTQLRDDMTRDTAVQNQRITDACTGANANLAQCMALAANANVVAGNLLTAALVYADTPEKKQLVGELIDKQISDMDNLYTSLEGKTQAAGVKDVLGAAIAGTLQAVAAGGIALPGKGAGTGGAGGGNTTSAANNAANAAATANVGKVTAPVDFAHVIGADYNAKTGKVTGGHSTLNNDVKVVQVVKPPDANGVYEAKVQMRDPSGNWIDKTSNGGANSMFPSTWTADRIKVEIDGAWNSPGRKIEANGKWSGTSPSGVRIEGWTGSKTTAYPIYGSGG